MKEKLDRFSRQSSFLPIFILPLILVTGSFISALSFSIVMMAVTLVTSILIHFVKNIVHTRFLFLFSLLISAFFSALIAIVLYFNAPKLFDYFGLSLCFLSISQIHFFNPKRAFGEQQTLFSSLSNQFKQLGLFATIAIGVSLVRETLGHGTITYGFDLTSAGQIHIPGLYDYPVKIVDSPVLVFIFIALLLVTQNRKKVSK